MKEFNHTLRLLRADLSCWKINYKLWKSELKSNEPILRNHTKKSVPKIEARIIELERAITILKRND